MEVELIIACSVLAAVCIGLIVYIVLRPTMGKASKSIFDVGYNHIADNAPQIPDETEEDSTQSNETPAENASEAEVTVENDENSAK